jgi:hypothetical protein
MSASPAGIWSTTFLALGFLWMGGGVGGCLSDSSACFVDSSDPEESVMGGGGMMADVLGTNCWWDEEVQCDCCWVEGECDRREEDFKWSGACGKVMAIEGGDVLASDIHWTGWAGKDIQVSMVIDYQIKAIDTITPTPTSWTKLFIDISDLILCVISIISNWI